MIKLLDENYIDQIVNIRYLMQFEELNVNLDLLKQNEKQLKEKTKIYLQNNLNKNLYVFGYILDNKIIATASLLIHENYPSFNNLEGKKGRISTVFTIKDYRHQGYQKKVLKELLLAAKKLNLNSVKVNCNNPIAINIYKSLGFIETKNTFKINL
ncbi:MAG: GNAT family N-acetyltransferase [Bacilli bacterium]|nr:GNAT family N-acetyltransferase [Bacilli bacterium]